MERPGFGVGADAAILQRRNLASRPRMKHPLRIPVEERQVQRLIHQACGCFKRAIRKKRFHIPKEIVRPGASSDGAGRGSAAAEVREQARTRQNPSRNDQYRQSNEQHCAGSRNAPALNRDRWLWEKWHLRRQRRGRRPWCDKLARQEHLVPSLTLWCGYFAWELLDWRGCLCCPHRLIQRVSKRGIAGCGNRTLGRLPQKASGRLRRARLARLLQRHSKVVHRGETLFRIFGQGCEYNLLNLL